MAAELRVADFPVFRRLLPVIALIAQLAACATNPVTGGSDLVLMSEAQEISLGRKYSAEITKEIPAYEDPALARLVQTVGDKVAASSHRPDLIYRFTVLDTPTVNAFALPGGYIYITRGLLAYLNSEAELAAVLGHEIGHVTARHSVRQHSTATVAGILGTVVAAATGIQGADTLTNLAGTAIVRGYGREHELEADRLGAEYLAKSGYDPHGMLNVVGVLKNQEAFDKLVAEKEGREPSAYHGLFATHPDNDTRFQEVVRAAAGLHSGAAATADRAAFLQAIAGLTFGERDEDGVVRKQHYYHKTLDFSLTFPDNWRIDNRADRVLARSADNDGLIQVTVTDLNKRITPAAFMSERLQLENMQHGESFRVGDYAGYTAIADGGTPYGERPVRYVVIFRDTRAWIIAGAAKERRESRRYDADILATARSFHALSAAERPLATAHHLALIRTAPGSRYADLAKDSPLANFPEQQLRLLNNQYPTGEPDAGSLLKIVR
ncbi:MAG: M48 family metalloprotease [Pseudomonadota bacterium]